MKPNWICFSIFLLSITPVRAQPLEWKETEGSLQIRVNQEPFAEYVYEEDQILRPYFAQIHAPNGVQVSRNHPPVPGQDPDDHAAMHPGIWLAFGDISGFDYWRNKAPVKHLRFTRPPQIQNQTGSFATLNSFLHPEDESVLCYAEYRFHILPQEQGTLLIWNAEFYSDNHSFVFGDQEEMGLGIRTATPIIVNNGGTIFNQEGLRNEEEVWGEPSDWCVYQGVVHDSAVGMMIIPSPQNFRPSWFHARNYGLLAANPFGKNAFTKQEPGAVEVKPGERFHLQFGIYIFSHPNSEADWNRIYQIALKQMELSR